MPFTTHIQLTCVISHHTVVLFLHFWPWIHVFPRQIKKVRRCPKWERHSCFWKDAQVEDGDMMTYAVFINWVDQSIERHPENMTTEVNPQTKVNLLGQTIFRILRLVSKKKELGLCPGEKLKSTSLLFSIINKWQVRNQDPFFAHKIQGRSDLVSSKHLPLKSTHQIAKWGSHGIRFCHKVSVISITNLALVLNVVIKIIILF